MKKEPEIARNLSADPVYLASAAVSSLIQRMPSGTAYFMGIVIIAMMSGRLMQSKGSLARAVLPLVAEIKWGWHRVHRAMERGKFSLDECFELMCEWSIANLPVEPVTIGSEKREVVSIDSSTIARLRSGDRLALAGKGYWQKAERAVRANIVAAATSVVFICGIRVRLVRRVRYGESCEAAVENLFKDLPKTDSKSLIVVDAGIATKERFTKATEKDALLGRLRINAKLRCAPRPRNGNRGRFPVHGAILHPGQDYPEVDPSEDFKVPGENGEIRIRRWNNLHHQEYAKVILDVARVDDPTYPNKPLIIGTTARELKTEEMKVGYRHRWPVETNFFVAQDTTAMEMPRAWTEQALERRIGLALLTGSLLKAISAACPPIAIGPWDRKAQASAGRLANYLDIHLSIFKGLALKGISLKNYIKIQHPSLINDLQNRNVA